MEEKSKLYNTNTPELDAYFEELVKEQLEKEREEKKQSVKQDN